MIYYATSSSLANLNLTSAHGPRRCHPASGKAHFLFLASLQASLIRSSFAMLTLHTAAPTTAQPARTPGPPHDDPPSPAPSILTTDDDDNDETPH